MQLLLILTIVIASIFFNNLKRGQANTNLSNCLTFLFVSETLVEDKLAETCFPLGDDQQLLGIATFQVTTAVLGVLCSIGTLAMVVNTYRHWKKRNEMKNRGLLSRSNRAPLEESTPLLE